MERNNYFLTYSSYNLISENNKNLNKTIIAPKKVNYNMLLKSNKIGCLTAIYNAEELGKIYMPLINKRQDYGLWLKILKKIDYAYGIEEVLATYRILNNSISSNKVNLLKYNYRLFREHEKLSVQKSIYYLLNNIFYKLFY
jgi:hypothetical protein